jgi:metal-dependent amidase/aminoacylase/carboxypeptidase family protein
VEAVYGVHNWPELPVGQFAIQSGPMMAAFEIFEIEIKGRGAHYHHAASCGRSDTSRKVRRSKAVVSVTQIHKWRLAE